MFDFCVPLLILPGDIVWGNGRCKHSALQAVVTQL